MSDPQQNTGFVVPKRVRTPWSQRLSDLLRGPLQAVAWLALGAAGVVLTLASSSTYEITGLAVAEKHSVRSQVGGQIQQVHVAIGDLVAAGATIATLDSGAHGLALGVSRARLSSLSAEVESTLADQRIAAATRLIEATQRQRQRLAGTVRQVADEAANRERQRDRVARLAIENRRLRLSLVAMEAEQTGRRIAAKRARQIAARAEKLARDGVDRLANAKDFGLEADELEASVVAFDGSIEETKTQLSSSDAQLEQAVASEAAAAAGELPVAPGPSDPDKELEEAAARADLASLASLEKRLEVARAELSALEARGGALVLTTPVAGRITSISFATGSVILPGESVATVQSPTAQEIQIYLPEQAANAPIPAEYLLASATRPGESTASKVLRVSDSITRLPESLQLDPSRIARGRAVHLAIPDGMMLLTGERVLASPVPTPK